MRRILTKAALVVVCVGGSLGYMVASEGMGSSPLLSGTDMLCTVEPCSSSDSCLMPMAVATADQGCPLEGGCTSAQPSCSEAATRALLLTRDDACTASEPAADRLAFAGWVADQSLRPFPARAALASLRAAVERTMPRLKDLASAADRSSDDAAGLD